MAPSVRDWTFCLLSVALGVWTQRKSSEVLGSYAPPLLGACLNPSVDPADFPATTGYHSYDAVVALHPSANVIVCFMTHFFYDMVQNYPGGLIAGLGTYVMVLPVWVLMGIEAGRKDAWGPIRYPMILAAIMQLVGISVGIPIAWMPAYILGAGKRGGVTKLRVYLSFVVGLTYLGFATSIFLLSPESPRWTRCSGILGGPAIVLSFALLWTSGRSPDPRDQRIAKKSIQGCTMAYATTAVVCLFGWLWLVILVAIAEIGLNPGALYDNLWGKASPPVQFATLNLSVLWLSMLLLITYLKDQSGLEALALSFLFGPGSGVALGLAGVQIEQRKAAKRSINSVEEDKAKQT